MSTLFNADDANGSVRPEPLALGSQITSEHLRIPPGPDEPYNPSQDLLSWMNGQFQRFGDIYRASVYGTNVYVVSEPRYVDYILRENWQNYRKGQAIKRVGLLLGNGLMVSEGEFWKKQRRMIQPAFHNEVVGRMRNLIIGANAALLEKWIGAARKQEKVNITRDISFMVLKVVLISIFGDDYQQVAPHFAVLSEEAARDLQFAQEFRSFGQIVSQVAAQRRGKNVIGADILGMLMEARDRESGQSMPDRQLVSEILTLVVAGHETTASTLNFTWYLLSRHPEVEEKLSEELDSLYAGAFPDIADFPGFPYTRHVVDEAMRLYPPGWLMTRKARKDDRLGDYFVPAGTEIYISPYLIQRHPALWECPDRFNPDRFESDQSFNRPGSAMLPFSAGPRKCIGDFLARIEMQIHLMMIAKQLRLRSAEGNRLELDAGVNLRNKHDFIMSPQVKEPRALPGGVAARGPAFRGCPF